MLEHGCKNSKKVVKYLLGVEACAWGVEVEQQSDQRISKLPNIFILNSSIKVNDTIMTYNSSSNRILFYQGKYRSHTWKCNNINQSEASNYSLLRKVSDCSDNLNLV